MKIIDPKYNRAQEDYLNESNKAKFKGFHKLNIWFKVQEQDVPAGSNVLEGRFLLTLKNQKTPEEESKVGYVSQWFKDRYKPHMIHDVSTIRISSIRTILTIASLLKFILFSHYVTQVYLQSKKNLSREVYIQPKVAGRDTFGLLECEIVQLIRPLYRLCVSGDYWGRLWNNI